MRANNLGSGPVHWMEASLVSSLLAQLTQGLEPYPASTTWMTTTPARPVTPARDRGFPVGWVALTTLAGAAVVRSLRYTG
jgi:hypothetical protein